MFFDYETGRNGVYSFFGDRNKDFGEFLSLYAQILPLAIAVELNNNELITGQVDSKVTQTDSMQSANSR